LRLKFAAALLCAASLAGCSGFPDASHPTDQQIIEEFGRQRVELEALAGQVASDPAV